MIVPGSANALMLGQTSGAYTIAKSLRFRNSAAAYLNRTPSSTGNRQKFTFSAWIKGYWGASVVNGIFGCGNGNAGGTQNANLLFYQGTLQLGAGVAGVSTDCYLVTTAVYRDPSSWYHLVVAVDTTQATASDRVKFYINGVQITSFSSTTYPAQNYNFPQNSSSNAHRIGNTTTGSSIGAESFDGYMAEINYVDGQQLTPSSFGANDATTGVWQPIKYTGTYGTNGFYLKFTDTTSTSTLGNDSSGNGNNWTTNNFSLTAGSTYDSMTDVPTLTSATVANYAVLNPLLNSPVLTNGNLQLGYNSQWAASTLGVTTGKFYFEATILSQNTYNLDVGVVNQNHSGSVVGASANSWGIIVQSNSNNGDLWTNGTTVASGVTFTTNDVVNVAFDIDAGKIWFGKNGTWVQSGNPATAANPQYTNLSGTIFGAGSSYQNSGGSLAFNFGQQGFKYTPPTGYVALNTYNLPTSTIVAGNKYMDATTYTGNTTGQSIVNAGGFKPDLVWIKGRSYSYVNLLNDSVRGVSKYLISNDTAAEGTALTGITSLNSNGFTLGLDGGSYNASGQTFVGWQWQAGQGTNTTNTNGSITSTVSVNASAGFSIVTYTGNGSNGASVGHGLGVTPAMVIMKARSTTSNWVTYHQAISSPTNNYLNLNTTDAVAAASGFCTPDSSKITFTTAYSGNNPNGVTMVAYCWAEIAGFSKFGSYTGNGSSDGTFIYLGFRPKYIMVKRSDSSGNNWIVEDSSRNTYNPTGLDLYPNTSDLEGNNTPIFDFLSNGIKVRTTGSNENASGGTYIYAAFAENPFKNALAR